ncbi:aryl-sulfate sulfotransferase [soil metagenome]
MRRTIVLLLFVLVSVAMTYLLRDELQPKVEKLGQVLYWAKDKTENENVMLVLSWPNDFDRIDDFYAYLMNRDGTVHHKWKFERNPFHARMLPNGNLLVIFMTGPSNRKSNVRGECDEIAEFNWVGKKLWSISIPMLHHDVFPIDDDRIVTLQSQPLSPEIKARFFPQVAGTAIGDSVIAIRKSTKEVSWRWTFGDVLAELKDRIVDFTYFDVAHINSVQYLNSNPWTAKPAYLISIRELSTILVIEEESKRILWKSPKGLFHFQHDAQLLEDGKLLVFDNGIRKTAVDSRILLINTKTNQIDWQWTDDKKMFASQIMGGVQRQPNGNFLVTNSVIGQLFEMTPDRKFVWNFIGKFDQTLEISKQEWWPGMRMYRVHSYPRPLL